MKSALGAIFGFLAGAILGFAAPYALFLIFYFMTPEEGRKQAGQAGTAFAIMMPLAAIIGAGVGTVLGVNRARTGRWQFASEIIDDLPGPKPKSETLSFGIPETYCAFRSLAEARVEWFNQQLEDKQTVDLEQARIGFLNHAVGDYRLLMRVKLRNIIIFLFLSCIIPFIFFPIFAIKVCQAYLNRAMMRDRLESIAMDWQIDIDKTLDKLPLSL